MAKLSWGGDYKIHLRKCKTDTSAPPVLAVGEKPEHCCCQKCFWADVSHEWEINPEFKTDSQEIFLQYILLLLLGAEGQD